MSEDTETPKPADVAGRLDGLVRLLIEADNSTRYTHVMVRKDGKDITTVGNLLVEISQLLPENLTLYDHWLALHNEIEKPLTISVRKKPNSELDR